MNPAGNIHGSSFRRTAGAILVAASIALVISACGVKDKPANPGTGAAAAAQEYSPKNVLDAQNKLKAPDYWPTAGWKTTTPEQQGMHSETLAEIYENTDGKKLDSMVVVRNGYLVAEGYSSDYTADKPHDVYSVTKSVLSALIGIAINEKKFPAIEEKAATYFPYDDIKNDSSKKVITIKDFLTMSAGLKWNNDGEASTNEMVTKDDWVKYVWDQPVVAEHGKQFEYSNGNPHVLSDLLQRQTGMTALDYAKEKLFAPLGILKGAWNTDNRGVTVGAYSLHITPRDMAKFGFLYLHEGMWDGKQIVPKEWVNDSVSTQIKQTYTDGTLGGYGYLWWLKPIALKRNGENISVDCYYAAGSGDQRIFVVPELNMVVVFTANNDEDALLTERLMQGIVADAYGSDKPLPESPEATARLEKAILHFQSTSSK